MYPHIFDTVLDLARGPALLKLRLVRRDGRDRGQRHATDDSGWEVDDHPFIIALTRRRREHYEQIGVDPSSEPGDVSERVRVLTMAEYRAEVGDNVWRTETWSEDVPPPLSVFSNLESPRLLLSGMHRFMSRLRSPAFEEFVNGGG
jgi:hypothetical protein